MINKGAGTSQSQEGAIRKELEVDLPNSFKNKREKRELQIAIENNFNQTDVSRFCPNTKKW